MSALSTPPLGLVVLVRLVGLGAAAIGWVFGLVVCFVVFPLLPMFGSWPGLLLWFVSLALTPTFAFFTVRRFKDVTWNGLVDPIFAGGLGAFCGIIAMAIVQRAASMEIA
jgi:hypothetical protein